MEFKLKDFSWLAVGPLISPLLGLLITPILAWIFPQESIGQLSIYYIFIALLSPILTLSLHQSYVREYSTSSDKNSLIRNVIYPSLIITLSFVILILIFIGNNLSLYLFGFKSWTITTLLCLSLILSVLQVLLNHIIRMANISKIFALSQILQKIILISLLIVLLIFQIFNDNSHEAFEILIFIITLSLLASFTCLAYLTKGIWIDALIASFSFTEFKYLIQFSFPLIFSDLLFWTLNGFDKLYLKETVGFELLAVYSMAWSLSNSLTIVSRIFSIIWHPFIYKNLAQDELRKIHQNVISIISVLTIFSWFLFGIFAEYLILILPESYENVKTLVLLTITTPIFYIFSEATGAGIGISKKSINNLYIVLISLIINVILNVILVPSLGVQGSGIANAISYFLFFILKTEIAKKLWYSFDTRRHYALLILFIGYSIIINIVSLEKLTTNTFWVLILFIAMITLRKDILITWYNIKKLKW